jgi:hypothetical protein
MGEANALAICAVTRCKSMLEDIALDNFSYCSKSEKNPGGIVYCPENVLEKRIDAVAVFNSVLC